MAFNDVTLNKLKQGESNPEANPHWRNMSTSVINSLKVLLPKVVSKKYIIEKNMALGLDWHMTPEQQVKGGLLISFNAD